MPQVFYSRCKPYTYDAVDVALKAKRIFFGYCMRKRGATYDRHHLSESIVDVTCDDQEWERWRSQSDKIRQYNQNRNFAKKITKGSIALIPRPSSGVVYCGVVNSEFELVDNPQWYDAWEKIWNVHDNRSPDDLWIAGEIAQTWSVDKFRPIPIPRIPVWIRRSLFGRSTYGMINSYGDLDPHPTLKDILEAKEFAPKAWTTDVQEVERRLITDVTPNAFEHLVVSLLQLENPCQIWTHVGGSGDGGVDGIGADPRGNVVGLLQCKWSYNGEALPMDPLSNTSVPGAKHYLAAAFHPDRVKQPEGYHFINKHEVARLLIKHSSFLPQSMALRVGNKGNAHEQ